MSMVEKEYLRDITSRQYIGRDLAVLTINYRKGNAAELKDFTKAEIKHFNT